LGDTYNLLNHDWHLPHYRNMEKERGSRAAGHAAGSGRRARQGSIFLIKCTGQNTPKTSWTKSATTCRATPSSAEDFLSLMTQPISQACKHSSTHDRAGHFDRFVVIFLTMYTTVIERTRDIGVLKSLGADIFHCSRAAHESAALCALESLRASV